MLYKIMEKNTQKISPDEEEIIFECEKKNLDDRLSYLLLFNLQKKRRKEVKSMTVQSAK